jgi:hypothetical protein
LQALVNLKRPTLLLQPLETAPTEGEITSQSPPLHQLKFNYDASHPLVSIVLTVHPTPNPIIDSKLSMDNERDGVRTIYAGIHPGGFNQVFTLPGNCAFDLSSVVTMPSDNDNAIAEDTAESKDIAASAIRGSEDDVSTIDRGMSTLNVATPDLAAIPESTEDQPARRFGIFSRRQAERDVEQGPIEMTETKVEESKPKEIEKGMRVLIRIEAVGQNGEPIDKTNAQLTHILINGMWVPDAGSTAQAAGKRVWVIKVVRREAVVGLAGGHVTDATHANMSRSERTPSFSRKSTASPPLLLPPRLPHLRPTRRLPRSKTHTHPLRTSVSFVSPQPVMSFCFHADIWSFAGTVPSAWWSLERVARLHEGRRRRLRRKPM